MKNMKNILKILTAASLVGAMLCTAGCGKDTSWSFKTEETTISNGEWIFATMNKYNEAMSKISEASVESSSDSETSKVTDVTKEKIEDKNAVDWIYDESKAFCVKQMTVEKLIKDKNVKYDKAEMESNAEYLKSYYDYNKETYEKLGVGVDSFINYISNYDFLSDKLFYNVYGKDGEFAVSDAEIEKYLKEKYTNYFYISYSLTSTDDDGNTTDISAEDKDKATVNFNKYRHMINNENKTRQDVEEAYKTDFSAESAPVTSKTEILDKDNSTLSEELQKAILKLEDKKSEVVEVDKTLYLIYKGAIADQVKNIKSRDEASENEEENTEDVIYRETLLYSLKKDDYDKYLDEQAKALKYDENADCLSKYSVNRTIDIIKAQEAAAAAQQ